VKGCKGYLNHLEEKRPFLGICLNGPGYDWPAKNLHRKQQKNILLMGTLIKFVQNGNDGSFLENTIHTYNTKKHKHTIGKISNNSP